MPGPKSLRFANDRFGGDGPGVVVDLFGDRFLLDHPLVDARGAFGLARRFERGAERADAADEAGLDARARHQHGGMLVVAGLERAHIGPAARRIETDAAAAQQYMALAAEQFARSVQGVVERVAHGVVFGLAPEQGGPGDALLLALTAVRRRRFR